ncbi:anthranilate phosphoribosyltransferase [Bacillaceae bacterium]
MFQRVLNRLVNGESLTREEARDTMEKVMSGEATPSQIASFLTALRMKGESVDEITGFAETMRKKAEKLHVPNDNLLDTCGTGGDGGITFNISTAAAIVAAAGGVRIAKHGNRAVSGKSGSADVLEALGIAIQLTSDEAVQCLEETNLCFLFAPLYHKAMKHAVAPRKEIGFRTVFNLLGPLTNPAGADRQLIGVYDVNLTEKIAQVAAQMGLKRALVVSGYDGLDEISISDATKIVEVKGGAIEVYELQPQDVGLPRYPLQEVAGGTAAENARIIRSIFEGKKGAFRDIVVLNTAAALYLAEKAASLKDGVRLAQEIIDSGEALGKLEQLVRVTRRLTSRAS